MAGATCSCTTLGETGKPLTTHQWYDGTQHPWEFKRVWHLEPSLTDPDTVYAGVEDAALFRSTDGGHSWHELPGCAGTARGRSGSRARAACACTPSSSTPAIPKRIYIAISAAGRVPHRRRRHDLEAHQPRAALAVHSRSGRRGGPLRAPYRDASRRGRACCSCRSTGT